MKGQDVNVKRVEERLVAGIRRRFRADESARNGADRWRSAIHLAEDLVSPESAGGYAVGRRQRYVRVPARTNPSFP